MIPFLALVLVILAYAAGDVLLTRGMKRIGAIVSINRQTLARLLRAALSNGFLLGGLACEAMALIAYLLALSWADLSLVLPATAFSDVVVTLAAKYLLHERVSRRRWIGIVLISAGVALVSLP